MTRGSGETTAMSGAISANFRQSFGDLSARLTLRGLMEKEEYSFFEASAGSLSAEGVPDLDAGTMPTITGSTQDIRANGYFAIFGLDYAGKYIVDGSFGAMAARLRPRGALAYVLPRQRRVAYGRRVVVALRAGQ